MSNYMTPVPPMAPKAPAAPHADQDDTEDAVQAKPHRTNNRIYLRRKPGPKFRPSRIKPAQRQDFDPVTGTPNMSSQIRIQFQASDVLRQLEPLPPGPFGPQHQLVIARNMALIQGVTADSLAERKEAERKRREIVRGAKRALSLFNPGFQASVESEHEEENEEEDDVSSSESGGSWGGGSPPPGGNGGGNGSARRKRRLSRGSDKENVKRARLYANPDLQIQAPVDIAKLTPLPLRITYPAHPNGDRPDAWFIDNFMQLFRQINVVCTHYYGLHEIPATDEPWQRCKMTPEFLKWAEQVAEPDPRFGSWDELLRDRGLRKWFVMAVLMKVFKVKVFEEYLFGATREQLQLMHQVDRAFLGREGFQREDIRAKQARTILGSSSVTESFYPSVAKLTAQIALMLTPLTSYLYSLPPPPGSPAPLISDLYQSLHNLVSQAAYLSICVKLTPSIIQMYDLRPGDIWQPDDMHCLDSAQGFAVSKEMICNDYRQERHNIKKAMENAEKKMKGLAPPRKGRKGKERGENERGEEVKEKGTRKYGHAKAKFDKLAAMLAARLKDPPNRTHRALIKLSVWPVIRRYTPGSEEEDKQIDKPLKDKDGFRIFLIAKGAVVAYYGREEKRRVEDGYVGLKEWIEIKQRQREDRDWGSRIGRGARNAVRATTVMAAVLATGVLGSVVDRAIGAGGTELVGGFLESAAEGVMRSVVELMA